MSCSSVYLVKTVGGVSGMYAVHPSKTVGVSG